MYTSEIPEELQESYMQVIRNNERNAREWMARGNLILAEKIITGYRKKLSRLVCDHYFYVSRGAMGRVSCQKCGFSANSKEFYYAIIGRDIVRFPRSVGVNYVLLRSSGRYSG